MDPDEISKQADKERRKAEVIAFAKQKAKDAATAPLKFDSFQVYRKIFPTRFNIFLWLVIFFVPAMVVILIWLLDDSLGIWALYAGLASISLFILRIIVEFFRKVFTYKTYKHFIHQLPFPLEGWEKIGANPKLFKDNTYWADDCSVEVFLIDRTEGLYIKMINDALVLFAKDANSHFYATPMGKMESSHWKFVHALKIKGDANKEVIGDMYRLIQVYLKPIHLKHPVIMSVRIVIGDRVGKIDPVPYTD